MSTKVLEHIKFFARWLMVLLKSLNRRFIPISPPSFSGQILYDKKFRKVFRCKIRNYQDWITLRQVYFNEDYRINQLKRSDDILDFYKYLEKSQRTPLIIDCGANIGLSALYFLDEFPKSKIIAVEISKENCLQISKNVKNRSSISVLENAIACRSDSYKFVDPGLGANAFRADPSEKGDLMGVTINSIVEENAGMIPFIVKIDIEGGESDLFSENTDWLEKFPVIIVELHDWLLPRSASSNSFLRVISKLDRDFVMCGENVYSISNTEFFKKI
jgi:FkbM family methyltransferase